MEIDDRKFGDIFRTYNINILLSKVFAMTKQIICGETFSMSSDPTYPTTLLLRGVDEMNIPLVNGECNVDTTNWTAGLYAIYKRVIKDGKTTIEYIENINVILLDTITAESIVTTSEKIIKMIDEVIEGKISKDTLSQTIGDRSITRYSLTDLLALKREYMKQAQLERNSRDKKSGLRVIGVRM